MLFTTYLAHFLISSALLLLESSAYTPAAGLQRQAGTLERDLVKYAEIPAAAAAANTTASLLQVFQVYPPVLIAEPNGVFEITDGSANATIAVINDGQPACQQTLVTHTFAYSYGEPFVG